MKIWDLSIKKPVTVFMGLICLLVLGTLSYSRLKLAFLPKVDFPGIWVVASYPNQNPELLEREVTRPLEEALSTLKGVQKINSQTSADQVTVQLRFNWGMELDLIRLECGLKIEEVKATLPDGVRQINIFSFNSEEIPIVEARISAPGIDLSENYDLLERHVKQKLERIPGVAQVDLGGVLPKEVSIELRLDKIREHNVDVGQVIEKLANDNINISSGKVKTNGLVYNLRSLGKIDSLEAFHNLEVNNTGLRLSEIADVYYEEPPIGYRRHLDGDKALALEVMKESSANTVEVANEVNRVIQEEIAADPVLQGISLFVWGDQAKEITNGLESLTQAGFFGAFFAIFVLYFFLRRLTATLIVATAIPISIIGSFIFLYAMGATLNILTMMGLMLAVGMLVDNAVVVLESIFQKRQEGLSAEEATREGTREVITALIAATATTIIVFLTLVISDDNELAVWLGALGLTICITLAASLLVSTTVIPLFTSKFLKYAKPRSKKKELAIVRLYGRVLDWSLKHQVLTGFALFASIASIAFPFWYLNNVNDFKGSSEKTQRLYFQYEFTDFFFASQAEKVVNEVEAYLESQREAMGFKSIYSWMTENQAATTLTFHDEHLSVEDFRAYRKTIREGLPEIAGVKFLFQGDENDLGKSIRIQLFGNDYETLRTSGDEIAKLVENVEGLFDIRSGERSNKQELRVSVDRDQANNYDVSGDDIAQLFGFTLGGTYLPRFQNGERETEVTLGLRIEDRANIEDISRIPLGNGLPLGALAKFEFVDRPETIRRVDRKAYHAVRANYEGENFKDMMNQVESILDDYVFPPGVSWSWNDRILRDQNDMKDMMLNILLSLILVYLVMASLFESLVQPFMILSTIFFSLVGVMWIVLLTRTEFGVMAFIGIMILIGIVVNNGIIMMDRINQLRDAGLDIQEAVRQGAKDRIRPILMTASTTIIGLIPMAIGKSGVGGAYYFPLARTVIGGLTSSTMLTLIGLPFLILTTHRFGRFVVRLFSRKKRKAKMVKPVPAEA